MFLSRNWADRVFCWRRGVAGDPGRKLREHRYSLSQVRKRVVSVLAHAARHVPAFRGKVRALRALSRVVLGGGSDGRIEISQNDGTVLSLDPRSRTEGSAVFNGYHEVDEIDFFRCCVSPGDTVLDIGANVGLMAVPLAQMVRPAGRLLAIEPVRSNAEVLRKNVDLNGATRWVKVYEMGLGASEGSILIGRERGFAAGTGNAYVEASAVGIDSTSFEWSTAPERTLDSLELARVDFIKIDVEGAEFDVLLGGMETVRRCRPIIYGEFQLTLRPNGPTLIDVGNLFAGLNYRLFAFDARLHLVDVPFEAGRGNVVLAPCEIAADVLERCAQARKADLQRAL
jgi:FkbM family methyltransferase